MKVRVAYKNGGSTGINLPVEYGILPGTHMIIEKVHGQIILKRLVR